MKWRAAASEDRHGLFDRIAADNPAAALALDDEIERKTDALPERPDLYRAGRMRGTREMVPGQNHILVYRVLKEADEIEILRIVGARQDYPGQKRK